MEIKPFQKYSLLFTITVKQEVYYIPDGSTYNKHNKFHKVFSDVGGRLHKNVK